jgi:hypothetical protein
MVAFSATVLPITAVADGDVWFDCDPVANRLVISYDNAWALGEKLQPGTLLVMRDDDHIARVKTLHRQCLLSDGAYEIRIWAAPGNFNVQGECGGEVSAGMEIRHRGKRLSYVKSFEPFCHALNEAVLTRVEIRPGSRRPIEHRVPLSEFYR